MKRAIFSLFFLLSVTAIFCGWNPNNTNVTTAEADHRCRSAILASNHSGYGVATWGYYDSVNDEFYVQASITNNFGMNWSTATKIDPLNFAIGANANTRPRVAIDNDNHAIIIWHRYVDATGNYEVRVTPYGASAQKITLLDTSPTSDPTRPEIAMNNLGNAIAIWSYGDISSNYFIKTAYSSDYGKTWSTPFMFNPQRPSTDWVFPQIIMDDVGHAFAVWEEEIGYVHYVRYAISTDFGHTWSTPSTIDGSTYSRTNAFSKIAWNSSGNTIITWQIRDTSNQYFTKVAYSSDWGATWSAATTLDPLNPALDWTNPEITMDDTGRAIITWQAALAGPYDIQTVYSFDYGKTWSPVTTLDLASDDWSFPKVAMDKTGNAIIVWNFRHSGGGNIWDIKAATSSDYGKNWAITTLAPNVETITAGAPRVEITMDPYGNVNATNGLAIWANASAGASSVDMNHYQIITLSVSGQKDTIRSFLQEELRNKITAAAIGQMGTYNLYTDPGLTQLIDSVRNDTQMAELLEHRIKSKDIKTYFVTWTDDFGNRTGPVQITIRD